MLVRMRGSESMPVRFSDPSAAARFIQTVYEEERAIHPVASTVGWDALLGKTYIQKHTHPGFLSFHFDAEDDMYRPWTHKKLLSIRNVSLKFSWGGPPLSLRELLTFSWGDSPRRPPPPPQDNQI